MKYKRAKRVQELLQEEISKLIQFELKDPRIGFATVTDVELTDNLKFGRVYVSILGEAAQQQDSLEALNHARGFIRGWLGKHLYLKFIPELRFFLDTTAERAQKISKIIDEFHAE